MPNGSRTYALLDPPAASRAHLFGEILDLDAELDLACEWSREDTARSRRRMSSARRHYHQKRYSMLAHASAGDAPPQAQGALEDRAAQAEAVQLGEALRELVVDGMPFGEHSLSVVLRAAFWRCAAERSLSRHLLHQNSIAIVILYILPKYTIRYPDQAMNGSLSCVGGLRHGPGALTGCIGHFLMSETLDHEASCRTREAASERSENDGCREPERDPAAGDVSLGESPLR